LIAYAKQKVREGKIVKVEVEYDGFIKNLKITGDFFLHPEDVLDEIEKSLSGLEKEASVEAIASKIHTIMAAHDARMIGVSPESIAEVLKEALK
jgi:lipoate-protein ligase A